MLSSDTKRSVSSIRCVASVSSLSRIVSMYRERMREIIPWREFVLDVWRTIDEDPDGQSGALILPLARWHAERERWSSWHGRVGVRISPAQRGVLLRAA